MKSHLNTVIDSLALDHKRGAAEIVETASQLFREIGKIGVSNPSAVDQIFSRAVRRLGNGQPSMASVLNLLNQVCLLREKSGDDWTKFQKLLENHVADLNWRNENIVNKVKKLPRYGKTLMTFSNSSTVARLIKKCWEEYQWPEKVYLSESRPIGEGISLARKLRNAGLEVVLFTDAALMSQILNADIVWIGGDTLHREGLVNKVGSGALALLSIVAHKPFISLMTSDKILPPGLLPYFKILPQNPREISDGEISGIDVINEYYETTPNELVSFIFTEDGLKSPSDLLKTVEGSPVSDLFVKLISV